MRTLTIGQVAKLADVGIETIRFYEREGLIPEPPRRASGYREYPDQIVDRVRFIRRAKDLGFTLKEVGDLLDLRSDPGTTCRDVRARAAAKIDDIEERIRLLRRMTRALKRLIASCSGSGPIDDCPILDALDERHVQTTVEVVSIASRGTRRRSGR